MKAVTYLAPGFPESLFEAMADVLGAELHFERTMSGPAPGTDPFADGRYDLGWVCSTSFVDLHRRAGDDGRPPSIELAGVAWVPDDPASGGRAVYFGDLTVPSGSAVSSLGELRGARIGCNDPISLSGHHALRHAIVESGEDPSAFADLVFTGGHQQSLDLLVDGQLDAAVIDSIVRRARSGVDSRVDALSVIERLGPWPVQPLVVRAGLDDEVVQAIRTRLLSASTAGRLADELAKAGLSRLVGVGPEHYEGVRTAMLPGLAS